MLKTACQKSPASRAVKMTRYTGSTIIVDMVEQLLSSFT